MGLPEEDEDQAAGGDQDPRIVEWAAEIADRIRSGESVDLEGLTRDHPELAPPLQRLMPAIRMMAAFWPDPAAEPGESGAPGRDDDGCSRVLGDFQLVRVLGRGGMGIVYEALQLSLNRRRVALKLLSDASALDPRRVRRFEIEVAAVACLDHEHIVPIHAVGRERDAPYYVMKLIVGRSLAAVARELRRLKRREATDEDADESVGPDELATTLAHELASGRLLDTPGQPAHGDPTEIQAARTQRLGAYTDSSSASPQVSVDGSSAGDRAYFRTIATLGVQASEALNYAHREGVIHRDIKPANLLVDVRGHLWVTDFGLARLRSDSGVTQTNELVGTLRYMSPEQARASRVPLDHRTDVYSLGATLYEMLTLRPAFGGYDCVQLLRQIAEVEPTPLRRLNRRIPRDLETVVLKAMAKEPARRYQSAGDLADDLGRFLRTEPVQARRTPIWRRAVTWVKANRMKAALFATAIAATVLVASFRDSLRRQEADYLARRFESADVAELAEIIPRIDVSDPAVVAWLDELYAGGSPDQKLAASLVLAPTRSACRDYTLDRFLSSDPRLMRTLIPLLQRQLPRHLIARLQSEIDIGSAPPSPAEAESRDRRRANAACALLILGRGGPAWSLLRASPDPQARSFLIATLGPAGVDPECLLGHIKDTGSSSSSRSAAIQSLSEIRDASWSTELRTDVVDTLLNLYTNDPDAGVHGSAKWVLEGWKLGDELRKIDRVLSRTRADDPRFQWRISREQLTLITIDDPALNRVIEVSDCEITVEMFGRFRGDFEYSREFSDVAACPINSTSYFDAALFCNWLSDSEGISPDQKCYRTTGMKEPPSLPVPGYLELTGFRLSTAQEFDIYCSTGTRTRRYYGDTDLLLDRYAWTLNSQDGKARPVAGKIPNDLGLFDTLGNLQEWCSADDPIDADGRYTADLRGGWFGRAPATGIDRETSFHNVYQNISNPMNGFRVVRTKAVR